MMLINDNDYDNDDCTYDDDHDDEICNGTP